MQTLLDPSTQKRAHELLHTHIIHEHEDHVRGLRPKTGGNTVTQQKNHYLVHEVHHIWGEPERAPHLMMSTEACMSFVRSFCRRTYGKHSPGYEW